MNRKADEYIEELKAEGLDLGRETMMRRELTLGGDHTCPAAFRPGDEILYPVSLYGYHDLPFLQNMALVTTDRHASIRSLDELLERDRKREEDGFPRKIRMGRLVKPGKGGKDKIVVVPTTVEEKLIHDQIRVDNGESGGSGEGEEGEVIGKQPVRPEQGESGVGGEESAPHEMESSAYELGRILTEKFQLPNLKEKGRKRSLTNYTYDMTDRNKGHGQLLDKKATLKKIVETNITLGNIPDLGAIDSTRFLIAPSDMVYRVLSREMDYESQAVVFFIRDYSGSMTGLPTELVVSQHLMIYSWLYFQYARHVESRFILHDTEAREAPDFHTYYNTRVAGGTKVASGYRLVNEIVAKEGLERDYNIYVFHGTDGDDWDADGREAIPELTKMLAYSARIGITIARRTGGTEKTVVEKYIENSKFLTEKADLIRLDAMPDSSDEPRLIEGIRRLIS